MDTLRLLKLVEGFNGELHRYNATKLVDQVLYLGMHLHQRSALLGSIISIEECMVMAKEMVRVAYDGPGSSGR